MRKLLWSLGGALLLAAALALPPPKVAGASWSVFAPTPWDGTYDWASPNDMLAADRVAEAFRVIEQRSFANPPAPSAPSTGQSRQTRFAPAVGRGSGGASFLTG